MMNSRCISCRIRFFVYQSNPTNDPLNLIDDYTLVNARLWWASPDDDWVIEFEVMNLTDKLYYLTKFDQYQSVGQIIGQPGLPATYGISVRRNF